MKPLILAASILLATPAHAWQILPITYAKTFCEMRALGLTKDDATKAAIQASVIDGPDSPEVMVAGHKVRADALLAVKHISDECPQFQ